MFVIPDWLDAPVTAAIYLFALLKGRAPERILAGAFASFWTWNTFAYQHRASPRDTYELIIDVTVLLVTLALAFRFDRWWLILAGMMMVLRVATDIADFVLPLSRWAYGTALMTWGYVFLAALAAGTWESWRARRDTAAAGGYPGCSPSRRSEQEGRNPLSADQVRHTTWATRRSRRRASETLP